MFPPADDELEELEELDDRELVDGRSDVVGLLSLLDSAVVVGLAVVLSTPVSSRRNRATPMAASTTTPAMISAIRVLLLPFGC
jgi:hypothetical protein